MFGVLFVVVFLTTSMHPRVWVWSQFILMPVFGVFLLDQIFLIRIHLVIEGFLFGEFDSGSGRTLAACLTHASRTERPFGVLEWRTGE